VESVVCVGRCTYYACARTHTNTHTGTHQVEVGAGQGQYGVHVLLPGMQGVHDVDIAVYDLVARVLRKREEGAGGAGGAGGEGSDGGGGGGGGDEVKNEEVFDSERACLLSRKRWSLDFGQGGREGAEEGHGVHGDAWAERDSALPLCAMYEHNDGEWHVDPKRLFMGHPPGCGWLSDLAGGMHTIWIYVIVYMHVGCTSLSYMNANDNDVHWHISIYVLVSRMNIYM